MTTPTAFGYHLAAPASAPTTGQGTSTGSLNGSYQWQVTFIDGYGETVPGPATGTQAITSSTNALLTAIPTGPASTTGRKIYRTVAGPGTTFKLVGTINDNTTTTYSDTVADGSLGANAPVFNTADSVQNVYGYTIYNAPSAPSNNLSITAVSSGTQPVISAANNIISTCPSGGQVTLLPLSSSLVGLMVEIRNNGANPCLINPSSGQTINSGASLALLNGAYTKLVASSATNWIQLV